MRLDKHMFLAEHHLYGSSRLGIKKYLPSQYQYVWALGDAPGMPHIDDLGKQLPWHHYGQNDFIKLYDVGYTSTSNFDKTHWFSNHNIGLKHYELNNHLGNVQAVVLDRYSSRKALTTDAAYTYRYADIKCATDHYAFGSPMPLRDTSSTAASSFYTTMPYYASSHVVIASTCVLANMLASLNAGSQLQVGSNCVVTVNQLGGASPFGAVLTPAPGLMTAGKTYRLRIYCNSPLNIQQVVNGTVLASYTGTGAGPHTLDFIAYTNQTFEITYTGTDKSFAFEQMELLEEVYTLTNITVKINTGESDYRYSFQTQERVDEIAGAGNHTTALFWEYDTRLGRRWNLDPKPTASWSGYSCLGNNPIFNTDFYGDSLDVKNDGAKSDLLSTVNNDNTKYVKFKNIFNKAGELERMSVTLDFGDKTQDEINQILASDIGLTNINDMVNATKTEADGTVRPLKFLFSQTDVHYSRGGSRMKSDVLSASRTPKFHTTSKFTLNGREVTPEDDKGFVPKGYDGYVGMSNKGMVGFGANCTGANTAIKINRASIIYHELRENYYRTALGLRYVEPTDCPFYYNSCGYYQGWDGAHNRAVRDEGKRFGNPNPGGFGAYEK